MVICHKRKLCFVHIPKTGGTSIESFLGLLGHGGNLYGIKNGKAQQHLTYAEIKRLYPDLDNYFTFALVRNPYNRFISEYKWCSIPGKGKKGGQTVDQFLDFIKTIIEKKSYNQNKYYDHFIPQHEFIFEGTQLKVKHLGRLEQIERTFQILRNQFDINKPNVHLNKTKGEIELTGEQKKKIFQLYKRDFQLLGYKV